ncbi:MAG TPA: SMP-30/gluconolactonase/LRE family protein [Gemmatimonadaceae bacterium]
MGAPELVADVPCRTGEGPLWHPEEECLYWMDIPDGHLFRYEARGGFLRVHEGPVLGAVTLQREGSLALLGIHGGVWLWRGELREVISSLPAVRGTRFNDALADPTGRILAGTMPTASAKSLLLAIEPNGRCRTVLSDLGQSNGMALSQDHRTLYHVDTRAGVLQVFRYDVETGTPESPRVIAEFPESEGVPDGMALDEEGCLWVAMWGGGCLRRLNAKGERIEELRVPTSLVSSVAFGGADLSDLYITTAGGDDRARHGALAGSLFVARPGVRGVARLRSALQDPAPRGSPDTFVPTR